MKRGPEALLPPFLLILWLRLPCSSGVITGLHTALPRSLICWVPHVSKLGGPGPEPPHPHQTTPSIFSEGFSSLWPVEEETEPHLTPLPKVALLPSSLEWIPQSPVSASCGGASSQVWRRLGRVGELAGKVDRW